MKVFFFIAKTDIVVDTKNRTDNKEEGVLKNDEYDPYAVIVLNQL